MSLDHVPDIEENSISSAWVRSRQDYISIGAYTIYVCQYLTTLEEEISIIWPQKWRKGKILFLIIRYNPFALTLLVLIDNLRNYSVDGPGSCEAISLVRFVVTFINNVAPELVLLILLHGVLGTKRRYLAFSTSLWMVLSLGVLIPQIMYFQKGTQADAVPRTSDGFNRFGRGYACSWYMFYPTLKGWESSLRIEAFVSLAKSLCTSALAITIFSLRYRSNRGPLVKVVRRDGGVCILSLAAIRIGLAVATGMNLNLQPVSASTSIGLIVHHTFTQLQDIVVPMLACRLLLNMRETELDCGAHTITSIFFAPPRSNGEPENAAEGAEDNLATRQAPPYAGLR